MACEILHKTFYQTDQEHSAFRNIFLVGHNIDSDIRFLHDSLFFDIRSIHSINAIIDTDDLGRSVFNMPKRSLTLKRTMSNLGMKARQCHNRGNDAVYSLKAMLGLFCNWQENAIKQAKQFVGSGYPELDAAVELLWRERLELLRKIARCYPRKIPRQEAKQATKQPKPARVDNPDFFESDSTSAEEMEAAMIYIFGDEA